MHTLMRSTAATPQASVLLLMEHWLVRSDGDIHTLSKRASKATSTFPREAQHFNKYIPSPSDSHTLGEISPIPQGSIFFFIVFSMMTNGDRVQIIRQYGKLNKEEKPEYSLIYTPERAFCVSQVAYSYPLREPACLSLGSGSVYWTYLGNEGHCLSCSMNIQVLTHISLRSSAHLAGLHAPGIPFHSPSFRYQRPTS